MMHFPLPLPILVLCIISFSVYLMKHRSRPYTVRRTPVPKNDYSRVMELRNEYKEYESESFDVSVVNSDKSIATLRHSLGSPVSLTKKRDSIYLVIDGMSIILNVPFDSKFRNQVLDRLNYRAFITDRDIEASGFYDFFTITVFYKLT